MSQKSRRSIPHHRPVSQNAYDTFVRYIYAVVPKDNRCADMIDALDKYLDGDRDTYASHLDEHTAITFEMLRFEIDKAIERSARARRPRRCKIESETTVPELAAVENTHALKAPVADVSAAEEKPVCRKGHALNNLSIAESPQAPRLGVSADETVGPPMLPRRIRRAAILALRPRHKWRKIG